MVELIVDEGENWQCPYCGYHQVVLSKRHDVSSLRIRNNDSDLGPTAIIVRSIACANNECRKMSLGIELWARKDKQAYGEYEFVRELRSWTLLPESSAKPQPEFIPDPIRADYYEACRIRDLSPKASATILRRCLQGMIRDFCGITKPRLVEEINELRRRMDAGSAPTGVQADTIDAIDHVRSIGNIGAHMELDVNVIVDVEPDEAQTLIGLIELLFEEWYVARDARSKRLRAIGVVAADKKAAKATAPAKVVSRPQGSEAADA